MFINLTVFINFTFFPYKLLIVVITVLNIFMISILFFFRCVCGPKDFNGQVYCHITHKITQPLNL